MLNKKPNKQNQNTNDKLKKWSEAQNTNTKGLFQRNIKNSWEWHQKDGRPGGPSLPTPATWFNKYLQMKIVLEELWSTIKKLRQPSRAQKNKDVWIEKYRKHFTCVIPSSRFTQLGAKRNVLSNNSPQMGEKESRKTPAAFTTKDLNSPHHYHDTSSFHLQGHLQSLLMSTPTWADGAAWSPGHCALSWNQKHYCSPTKPELLDPALHLAPPHMPPSQHPHIHQ